MIQNVLTHYTPMGPNATPNAEQSPNASWATTPFRFLLISLFWMPISLFWGAMLSWILPIRAEAFGGAAHSGTYLARLSIAGAACGLLVQFVIGPISDRCTSRFGRRRPFILVGTLLAVIAMMAFSVAGSFVGLVISFVFIQFFLNLANGPYQALIPDLVPKEHQGAASGYMGIMSLIGDAGAPAIMGMMLARAFTVTQKAHAVQGFIELIAVLLVASMAITVFAVPDSPAPAFPTQKVNDGIWDRYRLDIRQDPDFYWLLLSRSVYNLGFYTVITFLLFYVEKSLHRAATAVRPIQMLAIAGAIIGTVIAGTLADRLSKKALIYASTVFCIAAGIVFALTSSLLTADCTAFLFGAGLGMFRAVDWAFACNLLPESGSAAKYMSIWSLSTMVPQLAAPLFGPIADRLNAAYGMGAGYRGAMVANLVYTILGVLIIAKVREKRVQMESPT